MRAWAVGVAVILAGASSSARAQPTGTGGAPGTDEIAAPPASAWPAGATDEPAAAAPAPPSSSETVETTTEVPSVGGIGGYLDEHGLTVTAGLGVMSMMNERARDYIGPGASYTFRVLVGSRTHVGYEGAYIGSVAGISALGLDTGAILVSNGLEGAVRYNFTTRSLWQPYVLAGVAWRHYAITHAAFNQSSANGSDNVLELPLATGITWRTGGKVVIDGRFAYRVATGEDLLGGRAGGGPGLSNWILALKAGVEL